MRAEERAIIAIAHTLLKIAYQVFNSGRHQDPGADSYTRRESPEQKQAWLERQLQSLRPGCTITRTISPPEAALAPWRSTTNSFPAASEPPPTRQAGHPGRTTNAILWF